MTLASQTEAARLSTTEWSRRRRTAPAVYAGLPPQSVARACERDGARADGTVAAAERFLLHEFDLLGSGPFVPNDPDRPPRDGYQPIDWYLDPVRRLRFPRGVPYREWKLYEMRPGNADVKYPWELARCQHWATLGQAFLITGDERFAAEIARQLDDFVEANPVGIGINWTCTMDVGLRAVGWVIALDLMRGSQSIDEAWWQRAHGALFDHGAFTRANLENTYEVTSNHFLSNVVGLWFLGAVFADLPEGQEWLAFARTSLETEIDVQVLPDGADFESSVPYHRLVAELFLGSERLARFRGVPLSDHYTSRVRDMVTYLAAVLRPDGLMPQLGDADDGRLHVLSDAGGWRPQDPRHLFGPAGVMFGNREWIALGGGAGAWEAAWWGCGVETTAAAGGVPAPIGELFPEAGVAVAREASGHYLLVSNAIVGTKGFGNHKHNDQLSFEYHVGGVAIVADPGSFVYTSDAAARNLFRSTASHSTLEIDGVEQNEMNPEWLFRRFESARAEHLTFSRSGGTVEYRGRHVGYTRLEAPVTHERRFRFDRATGELRIGDRLDGGGAHRLRWHFHLAPDVEVRQVDARRFALASSGVHVELAVPDGLTATVSPAAYSPSYGVRVACSAIDLRAAVTLGRERSWDFVLTPQP